MKPGRYVEALREITRVTRPGGSIRISPCEPRFILEALQELPELQLDPRLKITSDYRVEWNGEPWNGELFVALIRKK